MRKSPFSMKEKTKKKIFQGAQNTQPSRVHTNTPPSVVKQMTEAACVLVRGRHGKLLCRSPKGKLDDLLSLFTMWLISVPLSILPFKAQIFSLLLTSSKQSASPRDCRLPLETTQLKCVLARKCMREGSSRRKANLRYGDRSDTDNGRPELSTLKKQSNDA